MFDCQIVSRVVIAVVVHVIGVARIAYLLFPSSYVITFILFFWRTYLSVLPLRAFITGVIPFCFFGISAFILCSLSPFTVPYVPLAVSMYSHFIFRSVFGLLVLLIIMPDCVVFCYLFLF